MVMSDRRKACSFAVMQPLRPRSNSRIVVIRAGSCMEEAAVEHSALLGDAAEDAELLLKSR